MLVVVPPLMISGQDLIAFVKQHEGLSQTELARAAGYVRTTEAGKEQVLVKAFYDALLKAQGLKIVVGKAPGKVAQYETTVHRSGIVLVGKTYTQKFGLEAGDSLKIVLEGDSIRLVPNRAKAPISGAEAVAAARGAVG